MAYANPHPAKANYDECGGTECPGGCCPEVDWYCCPDNLHCAATSADCSYVNNVNKLDPLVPKKLKQCWGTECPNECCPGLGWFCCPEDGMCASTLDDCELKTL